MPEAMHTNGEPLRLLVMFERDEDGWVVASCPTLPGCHSQGRTRHEALGNIREAVRGMPGEHASARRRAARVVRISGDRRARVKWRDRRSSQEMSP